MKITTITSVGSMPLSAMPLHRTVATASAVSGTGTALNGTALIGTALNSTAPTSAWLGLSRTCGTDVSVSTASVSTRDEQVQVVEALQAETARVLAVDPAPKPLGLEVRGYGRHQDQPQAKDGRVAGMFGDAGMDDSTGRTNPIFARDHWTSSPPG